MLGKKLVAARNAVPEADLERRDTSASLSCYDLSSCRREKENKDVQTYALSMQALSRLPVQTNTQFSCVCMQCEHSPILEFRTQEA